MILAGQDLDADAAPGRRLGFGQRDRPPLAEVAPVAVDRAVLRHERDVHVAEHAGAGRLHDEALEGIPRPGAGAARIDDRRHARVDARLAVGIDGRHLDPEAEDVDMHVDPAGAGDHPGGIEDRGGGRRAEVADPGNTPAGDRDVAYRGEILRRVDHLRTADNQVVVCHGAAPWG